MSNEAPQTELEKEIERLNGVVADYEATIIKLQTDTQSLYGTIEDERGQNRLLRKQLEEKAPSNGISEEYVKSLNAIIQELHQSLIPTFRIFLQTAPLKDLFEQIKPQHSAILADSKINPWQKVQFAQSYTMLENLILVQNVMKDVEKQDLLRYGLIR